LMLHTNINRQESSFRPNDFVSIDNLKNGKSRAKTEERRGYIRDLYGGA